MKNIRYSIVIAADRFDLHVIHVRFTRCNSDINIILITRYINYTLSARFSDNRGSLDRTLSAARDRVDRLKKDRDKSLRVKSMVRDARCDEAKGEVEEMNFSLSLSLSLFLSSQDWISRGAKRKDENKRCEIQRSTCLTAALHMALVHTREIM